MPAVVATASAADAEWAASVGPFEAAAAASDSFSAAAAWATFRVAADAAASVDETLAFDLTRMLPMV